MRLVVQRVNSAEVTVKGNIVGKINKGLFVLVGIKEGDRQSDALFLADKLLKLRIIADGKGKMNLSLSDTDQSVLVVSQFTLYADTTGGNRPSFIKAAKPEDAIKIYELFIEILRNHDIRVETGKFGEYMKIKADIDGPVTIIVDSK